MIYSCSRGITAHRGTFRLVMKMYEIIPAKLLPAKKNAPQEFVLVVKGMKRRRRNSQKYAALPLHTRIRTLTHTHWPHTQSGVAPRAHQALPEGGEIQPQTWPARCKSSILFSLGFESDESLPLCCLMPRPVSPLIVPHM